MPTGTQGNVGQRYPQNMTHHLVKRVTFATLNAAGTGAGTANRTVVVGVLPERAIILRGSVWCITGFNDTTGDDLDIGVSGDDDDLFHSACDVNSGSTLTAFDDLADANRYSADARTVTCNFTTAPTGDGTAGEAIVELEYIIAPDA